ncbi:MAG: hypothetical protein Q4B82_07050 [Alysiella sp.]|uniref:hypothetical protein n=1 Tax=Alysiella sp. TaxID=1872483 RepID=UPI0026DBA73B|nr:hypothetical protein [Alysiella sp.]MDO4434318.1 hypothetical protein [Alysiella sp.]
MQDFRIAHTDDLPDSTHLVKTELQQLQLALQSSQGQIKWQIHQPLSSVEIEKRIKMLKLGNAISAVLQIGVGVYIYAYMWADDVLLRNVFVFLIGAMIVGNFYLIHMVMPKRMRQNPIITTRVTLNWDKQYVLINEGSKQQYKLKFHSNKTLPAFVLPQHADADLRRLRDEVQSRITQITGLTF